MNYLRLKMAGKPAKSQAQSAIPAKLAEKKAGIAAGL